jgi:hypothetical protein
LAPFLDNLIRRVRDNPGPEPHRSRRGRAAPGLHPVGVAGNQPDLLGLDAEPFADDLGKAGFVTLPGRHRAEHQFDLAGRVAEGIYCDLRTLARTAGIQLD